MKPHSATRARLQLPGPNVSARCGPEGGSPPERLPSWPPGLTSSPVSPSPSSTFFHLPEPLSYFQQAFHVGSLEQGPPLPSLPTILESRRLPGSSTNRYEQNSQPPIAHAWAKESKLRHLNDNSHNVFK